MEDVHPTNLNAAINAVAQISEHHDAYALLGRREEPMEVNAVMATTQPPTSAVRTLENRSLDTLCSTTDRLCTKVAKLEAAGRTEKPHYKKGAKSAANSEPSRGPA